MKHIARLTYIAMPAAIVMAFLYAAPAETLGESSRLLYFHVPLAWVASLAFVVAGILSIFHLAGKSAMATAAPDKARNSASIGLLFTMLATASGSLWSGMAWGSHWNWDPRQTSIVILMLIYIAYFSLDSALANNPGRGRITSAYLALAMAIMPFFVFVIPRVYASLHPDPVINPSGRIHLEETMKLTLFVSIGAYTLLYLYLFSLKNRISALSLNRRKRIR
jgi:heme exporter protein C